ncbi:hypothetical protein B0H19DRAFT_134272 [Mycena capillaripes]|nr:hypothetical protein B0H19DRAFT_134272 [Mycena capillaripes]
MAHDEISSHVPFGALLRRQSFVCHYIEGRLRSLRLSRSLAMYLHGSLYLESKTHQASRLVLIDDHFKTLLCLFTSMFTTWPPGPLLRPPSLESLGNFLFQTPCHCTWPNESMFASDDMEKSIKSVSIYPTTVIFSDEKGDPILSKPLSFMGEPRLSRHKVRGEIISLTLHKRPNVHNDLELDVEFDIAHDCASFIETIKAQEVPPEVYTKIYILYDPETPSDDPRARLLKGSPALRQAINEVFTALAYSEAAEILGPVVEWNVKPKAAEERKALADTINSRFRRKPPPPVLILSGVASVGMRPLPDVIKWEDDADESIEFETTRRLPSPPAWNRSRPPPEMWVDLPIQNYGIHARNPDVPAPRYIVLSEELVGAFSAASTACHQPDMSPDCIKEAQQSLEAATASLKMTLVRGISDLWVSEHGKNSPPKTDVRGASDLLLDFAEDENNPGRIEAGLLVESCWLGSPHELATTSAGWLRFALRESAYAGPLSPAFRFNATTSGLETELDDDTDDSDGGAPALARLGSLLRLVEHRSPTSPSPPSPPLNSPAANDDNLVALSVRVCDSALVAQFATSPLPSFPPGALQAGAVSWVMTPARRNKARIGSPGLLTPSQTSTPSERSPIPAVAQTPPPWQGFMLAGNSRVVPAIRSSKGPKWPAVQLPLVASDKET